MVRYIRTFERYVIIVLIAMMAVTVLLATLDLLRMLFFDIFVQSPRVIIEVGALLDIFGMFLLILIGLELIHTLKTYLEEKTFHLEVVFTVALVAIARKVIILDIKETSGVTLLGIAAIIAALSVSYFYIRRQFTCMSVPSDESSS